MAPRVRRDGPRSRHDPGQSGPVMTGVHRVDQARARLRLHSGSRDPEQRRLARPDGKELFYDIKGTYVRSVPVLDGDLEKTGSLSSFWLGSSTGRATLRVRSVTVAGP